MGVASHDTPSAVPHRQSQLPLAAQSPPGARILKHFCFTFGPLSELSSEARGLGAAPLTPPPVLPDPWTGLGLPAHSCRHCTPGWTQHCGLTQRPQRRSFLPPLSSASPCYQILGGKGPAGD